MDQKLSHLVEQYQEAKLRASTRDRDDEESDEDLLELLENEDDNMMSKYRDERIQQLKQEFRKIDDATSQGDFGSVEQVADEKLLMNIVTKTEIVIVHFYQPLFGKCKKMNEKLAIIAEKHLSLKVLMIRAEDAPFLTTKLNIKVLPFVVIYKNGKELDRLVGFAKLGNDPNDFTIESLERYLYGRNVIQRRTINFGSIKNTTKPVDSEESDLDL